MFHHSSLSRTNAHSHSLITSHNNNGGTVGNHDASLQTHKENMLNAKTPLEKNSVPKMNRRRALGDISNRKSGNGNGGQSSKGNIGSIANTHKKNSLGGKTSNLSNYQTPHKSTSKNASRQVLGPLSSSVSTIPPISTIKKKAVSFAIHTEEPELDVKKVHKNALVSETARDLGVKVKELSHSKSREHLYDADIEVSAGRTADQERELLGDEIHRVDTETEQEINEILAVMRAYQNHKDGLARTANLNYRSNIDDIDQKVIDDEVGKLEDIDEDVFQSYLMFDEYNKVADISAGYDDGDDDLGDGPMSALMACMDDISI